MINSQMPKRVSGITDSRYGHTLLGLLLLEVLLQAGKTQLGILLILNAS